MLFSISGFKVRSKNGATGRSDIEGKAVRGDSEQVWATSEFQCKRMKRISQTGLKRFALQIIRLFSVLPKTTEAQVLGKQVLRSGTSVGANYREAYRGRSKAEWSERGERHGR
jgi:hypothetical protein